MTSTRWFSWLWPRPQKPIVDDIWRIDSHGNPTTTVEGFDLIIFAAEGGWKYALVEEGYTQLPFISERFDTMDAAKAKALANFKV